MQPHKLTLIFAEIDNQITIKFIGALTYETILPLWQSRRTFIYTQIQNIKNIQKIIFDFTEALQFDSAGFAVLVELIKIYADQQKIILLNPTEQMLGLMELYALTDWINSKAQLCSEFELTKHHLAIPIQP